MDYLQYSTQEKTTEAAYNGFKPYYKWITFNTDGSGAMSDTVWCFKPYYKWITFNTKTSCKYRYLVFLF